MADIDTDEIERLIQEVESGFEDPTDASTPKKPQLPTEFDSSPQSRVSFSTYTPVDSTQQKETPQRKPQGKLAPLGSIAPGGAVPQPLAHAVLTAEASVQARNSKHSPQFSIAAAAAVTDEQVEEAKLQLQKKAEEEHAVAEQKKSAVAIAAAEVTPDEFVNGSDVNLLPLVHARFVDAVTGIVPKGRWGHTMVNIGDAIYCFGGVCDTVTNDLFEFSLLTNRWDPAFVSKGAPPPPRTAHSAVVHLGRMLVIFGGTSLKADSPAMNDVCTFDVVRQEWSTLPGSGTENTITGRFGHSAVIHGDLMVVFGGKCNKKGGSGGPVLSNEVVACNLTTGLWGVMKKKSKKAALGESPSKDPELPNAPVKRFNHAACVVSGKMFIHGGETTGGNLSDLWMFDLLAASWTQLQSGTDAIPRSRHFMFSVSDFVLVVGGCEQLGATEIPLISGINVVQCYQTGDTSTPWFPLRCHGVPIHSSKRGFGATIHQGFVYLFGGVQAAESPNNAFFRFLAMDGVPIVSDTENSISTIMTRLRRSKLLEDIVLDVGGVHIGAHRVFLQIRAPKFLEEVQACRNLVEEEKNAIPVYNLEGNSRVKGLSFHFTHQALDIFLSYLYSGHLGVTEEQSEMEEILGNFAVAFGVEHLGETLAVLSPMSRGSTSFEKRRKRANSYGEAKLQTHLQELLESGQQATATILFQDPHTKQQNLQAIHPWILINACDVFRQLLKPVCVDGVSHTSFGQITAKLGHKGSKRSVMVGPVPIPFPSVKYIMRYLYTAALDIPQDATLTVMMAAHSLQLPRLRSYCESVVAREDVTPDTCCDYLSLSTTYNAHLLRELALLTAAMSFQEVQKMPSYISMEAALKQEVTKAAREMMGRFVLPSNTGAAEFKSAETYASQFQRSTQL